MPGDGADNPTPMAAPTDHLEPGEAVKTVGPTATGRLVVTDRRILEIAEPTADRKSSFTVVGSTRFSDLSRVTVSTQGSASNTVRWLAGGCLLYLGFSALIFGFLEHGDITAALFAFVVLPAGALVVARASDPPSEGIVVRLYPQPEPRVKKHVLPMDQDTLADTVVQQVEATVSPPSTEERE